MFVEQTRELSCVSDRVLVLRAFPPSRVDRTTHLVPGQGARTAHPGAPGQTRVSQGWTGLQGEEASHRDTEAG